MFCCSSYGFNVHFVADMDSHLSVTEKATSRAFMRMLGEASLFVGFAWRFQLSDNGEKVVYELLRGGWKASVIKKLAAHKMKGTVWAQGTGRNTREQILQMGYDDMQAVSDFIGDKK